MVHYQRLKNPNLSTYTVQLANMTFGSVKIKLTKMFTCEEDKLVVTTYC